MQAIDQLALETLVRQAPRAERLRDLRLASQPVVFISHGRVKACSQSPTADIGPRPAYTVGTVSRASYEMDFSEQIAKS